MMKTRQRSLYLVALESAGHALLEKELDDLQRSVVTNRFIEFVHKLSSHYPQQPENTPGSALVLSTQNGDFSPHLIQAYFKNRQWQVAHAVTPDCRLETLRHFVQQQKSTCIVLCSASSEQVEGIFREVGGENPPDICESISIYAPDVAFDEAQRKRLNEGPLALYTEIVQLTENLHSSVGA